MMRERERERERERVALKYQAILKKLAAERQNKGINQFSMARSLGLTESGYFKVEKGKTKLDVERLLHMLNTLDIPLKDFFKDME